MAYVKNNIKVFGKLIFLALLILVIIGFANKVYAANIDVTDPIYDITFSIDKTEVTVGDTVHISAEAPKAKDDIAGLIIYLENEDNIHEIELPKAGTEKFKTSISISDYFVNGIYSFKYADIIHYDDRKVDIDKYSSNNADLLNLTVSGSSDDNKGPQINNFSINKSNFEFNEPIKISFNVDDDNAPCNAQIKFWQGDDESTYYSNYFDANEIETGLFEWNGKLSKNEIGINKIRVKAIDKFGNITYYDYDSEVIIKSVVKEYSANISTENIWYDRTPNFYIYYDAPANEHRIELGYRFGKTESELSEERSEIIDNNTYGLQHELRGAYTHMMLPGETAYVQAYIFDHTDGIEVASSDILEIHQKQALCELKLDVPSVINNRGWIKFTPTEKGMYTFIADSPEDIYYVLMNGDDFVTEQPIKSASFQLNAGEATYLYAYNFDKDGNNNIVVKKDNNNIVTDYSVITGNAIYDEGVAYVKNIYTVPYDDMHDRFFGITYGIKGSNSSSGGGRDGFAQLINWEHDCTMEFLIPGKTYEYCARMDVYGDELIESYDGETKYFTVPGLPQELYENIDINLSSEDFLQKSNYRWYSFTAPEDGAFSIVITGSGINLNLYDNNGNYYSEHIEKISNNKIENCLNISAGETIIFGIYSDKRNCSLKTEFSKGEHFDTDNPELDTIDLNGYSYTVGDKIVVTANIIEESDIKDCWIIFRNKDTNASDIKILLTEEKGKTCKGEITVTNDFINGEYFPYKFQCSDEYGNNMYLLECEDYYLMKNICFSIDECTPANDDCMDYIIAVEKISSQSGEMLHFVATPTSIANAAKILLQLYGSEDVIQVELHKTKNETYEGYFELNSVKDDMYIGKNAYVNWETVACNIRSLSYIKDSGDYNFKLSLDKTKAKPGDTVNFTVSSDKIDLSHISEYGIDLQNEFGAKLEVCLRNEGGNTLNGSLEISNQMANGVYSMFNSYRGYYGEYYNTEDEDFWDNNLFATFLEIENASDIKYPIQINDISIDKTSATMGDNLIVSVEVGDNRELKYAEININLTDETALNNYSWNSFFELTRDNTNDKVLNTVIPITELSRNGGYYIESVYINDAAGFKARKEYNKSQCSFTITGASDDNNPPVLKSITTNKTNYKYGDSFTVTCTLEDDSELDSKYLIFSSNEGNGFRVNLEKVGNKQYSGTVTLAEEMIIDDGYGMVPTGEYNINWGYFRDEIGNFTRIDEYPGLSFTIQEKTSGGSGFGGGGGAIVPANDNKTDETKTIDNSKTTLDAKEKAIVSKNNGKTEVITTIDSTSASKIVDAINKGEISTVSIDAKTGTLSVDNTSVNIPSAIIDALGSGNTGSVQITTDAGSISFDSDAIKAISEQSNNKEIQLSISKTGDENSMSFDIKLTSGNTEIHNFNAGALQISVDIPTGLQGKKIGVIYTDSNGYTSPIQCNVGKDGKTISFKTGHLSVYSIVSDEEIEKLVKTTVKKLLNNVKLKTTTKYDNKKNIKAQIGISKGSKNIQTLKDLGYVVKYKYYRSTKSNKDYSLKKTSDKKTYTNSKGTKGKKYYYKARLAVYDQEGNLIEQTKLKNCKYSARTYKK